MKLRFYFRCYMRNLKVIYFKFLNKLKGKIILIYDLLTTGDWSLVRISVDLEARLTYVATGKNFAFLRVNSNLQAVPKSVSLSEARSPF